jgi:hypothetical protein
MTQQPTDWLSMRIGQGIALLLSLRLQGAPFAGNASDIEALCTGWLIALQTHPTAWDQGFDEARLEIGFQRLANSVTRWPSPAQLFEHLPPRAAQQPTPSITRQRTPEEQALAKQTLENLKQLIKKVKI